MDCLDAQETISAALDRQPIDPADLSAAKDHCRSCAECRSFVSALDVLARLPVPGPPDGLEERIVAAVRREAAKASASASERAPGAAPQHVPRGVDEAGPAAATAGASSPPLSTLLARLAAGSGRRTLALWASAAAVVMIATGVLALWGVRRIMAPPPTRTFIATELSGGAQSGQGTDRQAPVPGQAEVLSPGQSGPGKAAPQTAAAALVVFEGMVYRSAGRDESVVKEALAPAGRMRAALREGGLTTDRTVYRASDPARIYLEDEDGTLIAFERVTTSYQGRTYVLTSEPIERFGALATLPRRFTRPVAPDGSPTFEPAKTGDGSTDVYVATGRDASFGIALPPGARPDVADGWSWWAPASP